MKHRGSALITALFVVAVITIAAVALSLRIRIDIDRTTQLITGSQLLLLEDGMQGWSRNYLREDVMTLPIDTNPMTIDNDTIQSHLDAAEGRFNLNDVVTQPNEGGEFEMNAGLAVFAKLISAVDPTIPSEQANSIAKHAAQMIWQKRNSDDMDNVRFMSVSELRVVPGMTSDLYQRLLPFVVALPKPTDVDYKTVRAQLLASLFDNMNVQQASGIIEQRNSGQFHSQQDFVAAIQRVVPNAQPLIPLIDKRRYFLQTTQVKGGQQTLRVYRVLLQSDDDEKKLMTIFYSLTGF